MSKRKAAWTMRVNGAGIKVQVDRPKAPIARWLGKATR